MLRKIWASEQGAISLFLIIIITGIFFLNMVLIDFARIMVAELTVEKSLKAALRSEHADFDDNLYQSYRILALNQPQDIYLREILNGNLANEIHDFSFVIFDLNELELDTDYGHPLALLAVYRNQLVEIMKYQAPVKYFQDFAGLIQEPLAKITEFAPNLKSFSEMAEKIIEQNTVLAEVLEHQSAVSLAELQVIEYEIDSDQFNGANAKDLRYILDQLSKLDEARRLLELAKTLNSEIKLLNTELPGVDDSSTISATLNLIRNIDQSLVDQAAMMEELQKLLLAIKQEEDPLVLQFYLNELEQLIRIYKDKFTSNNIEFNQLAKNKKVYEELVQPVSDQQQQLAKQQAKSFSLLKNYFSLIKKLDTTDQDSAEINTIYKQLLAFNVLDETLLEADIELNPVTLTSNTLELLDKLTSGLGAYLLELRDSIFLEEYAFSYFNELEPELLESLSNSLSKGDLSSLEEIKLHITEQEIEYIIYGYESASLNLISAFRDIFIIRFIFNLIEALMNPTLYASGNPLVIFLEITKQAFTTTLSDFQEIIRGEEVPLMRNFKALQFGYRDYLKLLYLLRASEDEKLLRQLALTSFYNKIDLTHACTYGVAEIKIPINLWFLEKAFQSRNHIISRKAAFGY